MKTPITEKAKKLSLQGGFYYEINMVLDVINNNLLGYDCGRAAFLIHIKNLYEFFYGNVRGYRYVHAGHYIKKWGNKKPLSEVKLWKIKINQYLSHLTYERVTEKYTPLPFGDLYKHFRKLIIDFLGELPSEYLTPKLKELRESLKKQSI